jgi:Bacterial capsule synthesis protein PGA_cap
MGRRLRVGALAVTLAVGVAVAVWIVADSDEPDAPTSPRNTTTTIAEEEPPPEKPPVRRLTVAASGDILIHSPIYERALANGGGSEYDFEPMFAPLERWLERADLALCHVETSMSRSSPISSYPRFNSPPSLASAITASGWDACTTASNHAVDFGQVGVDETLEALDRERLEHAGTYASERASRRPEVLRAAGVEIALLSYTTDLNGLVPPTPWAVNVATGPEPVLAAARRAHARGADAVIVNIHWSSAMVPEYVHEPNAAQRAFASRLAGSPAITAVVGQGPHVVQPIERIDGKYVVFSEGNLISNQGAAAGLPAASQDGLIAFLELAVRDGDARVRRVRYLPVSVRHPDYAVVPATGGSAVEARERVVAVVGRGDGVAPLGE